MAIQNELRNIANGEMDLDSAPEYVGQGNYQESYNIRTGGSDTEEAGYGTNIESGIDVTSTRPAGINKGIGQQGFESLRKTYALIYNSQGYHLLTETDADTNTETILFTNLTDSGGVSVLNLRPETSIDDIVLVNDEFLAWTDTENDINFISLPRLKSGGFGVLTKEDFLLIRPQPLIPVKAVYNDDTTRSANQLSNKLFQLTAQYIGMDYTYSAFSTHSKRPVPVSESTPAIGTDVSKNNNLIITVNIGNNRIRSVVVGARYDNLDFFEIKRVDRDYVLALPNTPINVNNQLYERYDPYTNEYSFVFYNDGLYQPISALVTDLPYDYVPLKAGAIEVVNDNILALADVTEGYPTPTTKVDVFASSYNPNFQLPEAADDPLRVFNIQNELQPGFLGRHTLRIKFGGTPKTGDQLMIVLYDVTNPSQKIYLPYTVQTGTNNDLYATIMAYATTISASNYYTDGFPGAGIEIGTPNYFDLESVTITNANIGSGSSQSIHALKANSSYQLALSYRNANGQFFPLRSGNEFKVKTLSYAQTHGLTPNITWSIKDLMAPVGAVDYQWLISYNTTHENSLYTLASLINYVGTYNATSNEPALTPGTGTVGNAYQVVVGGERNLGNGLMTYNVGDYILYNGRSYDRIDKSFGDITNNADYIALSIQSLRKFNDKNTSSILAYDYSIGDRVTFAYAQSPTTSDITWFDTPAIDVEVVGFDTAAYLLKVRKSPNFNSMDMAGKNLLIEIYTPRKRSNAADETTDASTTVFYEIGERFTITDGKHDTLSGIITDGDFYFKTRQMVGSINPNTLYALQVEDPNFSDYYASNYYSYGRPRTISDVQEVTNKKASIRYSDVYVSGSKVNGLTRFFAERIYGNGDGESSSSYGAIRKLYQRGNVLMCIQETEVGYIPVFSTIVEDQATQQQYALSDKLFNKIRYSGSRIGMGSGKSTFAVKDSEVFFLDTNRGEPIRATLGGVIPIPGKVSKFFKRSVKEAVKSGYKIHGFYKNFSDEYVICIGTAGTVVNEIGFNALTWNVLEDYTVAANAITITTNPANGTVTYNNTTGQAIYTPNNGYTGNDSFVISFTVNGQTVTKNVCINVAAGITTINQFIFIDATNVAPGVLVESNSILVSGNNVPVPLSITGGEYSVNGGAWSTAAAYVNPNDTVKVRATSSATNGATVIVSLTISDKSDNFDIKTQPTGVGNVQRIGIFTRDSNTCPGGQQGKSYKYTVPANTYFAPTVDEANAMADADIAANGQSNANMYGTCSVTDLNMATVGLSNDLDTICSTPSQFVYYNNGFSSLNVGVNVYLDMNSTPVTGSDYLVDKSDGTVYELSSDGLIIRRNNKTCSIN